MFLQVLVLPFTAAPAAELPPSPSSVDLSPTITMVRPAEPSEGAELGYTYVEAGFTTYDLNDLNNENVDTYYGRGSLGLFKVFYVYGEYENSSVDFQNTDSNELTIGVGGHFETSPRFSLYGEAGYIYNSVSSDTSSIESDKSGYRVDGGVRWMALPWSGGGIELDGAVGYIDVENQFASSENPVVYTAGARFHFLGHFSVGAAYQRIDVDDRLIGNLRFSF